MPTASLPRRLQQQRAGRKAATSTTLPDAIEAQLQARAGGHCELCGRRLSRAQRRHHRWTRAQGGVDDIRNVVLVHFNCHNAIHANPQWSYSNGWLIDAPHRRFASRPLLLHAGTATERKVTLTSAGGYATAA